MAGRAAAGSLGTVGTFGVGGSFGVAAGITPGGRTSGEELGPAAEEIGWALGLETISTADGLVMRKNSSSVGGTGVGAAGVGERAMGAAEGAGGPSLSRLMSCVMPPTVGMLWTDGCGRGDVGG